MVHALVKACSLDKEVKDHVRQIYKHTQIGYVILVPVFIACGIAVLVLILQGQALLIVPVFGAAVIIADLFYRLTVKVTDAHLHFYFGIGLIQRRFYLADIEQCHETHTSFLSGWGINRTLRGWLYNVSGFSAVEIILKNGKRFIHGTDEPSKLCTTLMVTKNK